VELSEAIHAEGVRFVNASKKLISSNQSYADVLNLRRLVCQFMDGISPTTSFSLAMINEVLVL
jgi:hypothetical protein